MIGLSESEGGLKVNVPVDQEGKNCPNSITTVNFCPPPNTDNVPVKIVLPPEVQQAGNLKQAHQVIIAEANPLQGHSVTDQYVASPSVTKKTGPTGTMYHSVSPVRSRKRTNSSQP